MKKISLILFMSIFVMGCGQSVKPNPSVPVVIQKPDRQPPAEAMEPCDLAEKLKDPSFGSVVNKLGEVSDLLLQCEQKRKELSDFIRGEIK